MDGNGVETRSDRSLDLTRDNISSRNTEHNIPRCLDLGLDKRLRLCCLFLTLFRKVRSLIRDVSAARINPAAQSD